MAVTVTFTVNEEFDFEFTIGVQWGEGIVVHPDKQNLDAPGFLEALKSAAQAFPIISDALRLEQEAVSYAKVAVTDAQLRNHLYGAPDDYLTEMIRCYAVTQGQTFVDVTNVMRRYAEAVKWESDRRQKKDMKEKTIAAKRQTASPGYVYLIQSPSGAYKIGRSKNPENRLKTFGVKLPFEVEYIAIIRTSDMYALESDLHIRYSDKRVNGEWFALAPADVDYIKSLAVQS